MMRDDLTSRRFGRLTAVACAGGRRSPWVCQCDCGNKKTVLATNLKQGKIRSCGCLSLEERMGRREDLTGQRFGRWLVSSSDRDKDGNAAWRCTCDCGSSRILARRTLLRGLSRSCGCAKRGSGLPRKRWRPTSAHRRIAIKCGLRVTSDLWEILCEAWGNRCAYCQSAEPTTIDHIDALSTGGTHEITNIAPACQLCNFRKGARPLPAALDKLKVSNFHQRRARASLLVQEKVDANARLYARCA